ncbi:MAG: sigma 54-interacting transcriptional regulator [Deltaproteobacteria bacterium]|nr:sigma 54-interacting transcriptional regulator [Deltaproteobacteria bacterium]
MIKTQLIANRYEIIRELGKGAGGEVWLAKDCSKKSLVVALKILTLPAMDSAKFRAFQQECRLLQGLDHPHVARLYDYGQDGDRLYYSSEYVEGSDIVSEAKVRDWNAVFRLIVQAAWALQYLHDQHVIHRDLKTHNILVGKIHRENEADEKNRLQLKVIDFGLATLLSTQALGSTPVGSLDTMAPEILQGKAYDHRADLYSLGVVFYEMALGKLPAEQQGRFADYLEKLTFEKIDLEPLRQGDTPRGVVEIIARLVQKDPSQRLTQASDIIRILNEYEKETFPLVWAPPSSPQTTTHKKQKSYPVSLSSTEALQELQRLARSGDKTGAWAFAEPYLQQIHAWKNKQEVEDFFASAIHGLIEQGRFVEAQNCLRQMQNHPLLVGKPSLESELMRVDLACHQGHLALTEEILAKIPSGWFEEAPFEKRTRYEHFSALVAQAKKDFSKAVQHYAAAAKWAAKAERKDNEASLLANAGTLQFDQGNWQEAYQLFQQALTLARELDHKTLVATLTNNLGNIYLYFGRWSEAEQAFSESLQLAQREDLKPLQAYNLYLLSVSEEGKGNWEQVKRYLDQALAYAMSLQDAQPILQALLARGYFELHQCDFNTCHKTLAELRFRATTASQRHYLLQADWLEAKLRTAQGRVEDSQIDQWLQEVKEDANQRGMHISLWQMYVDSAELAFARGNWQAAQHDYETALKILNKLSLKVPGEFRESFFRDRKKEKVKAALRKFEVEPKPIEEEPMEFPFQKWIQINRRLLVRQGLDPLLAEILDAAIELTDAERGFVIHSERQAFEVRAARNLDRETLQKEEEKFSYTIAQEVMHKGAPVVVFDAQQDERFSLAQSVLTLKLRSVLCVPLQSGSRTVGLIYLDNRFREGVFEKQHLSLIEALADQATLALEHARLHQENAEKIEELKKSKTLIETLNSRLQKDLGETSANLEAMKENLKRQNEEIALCYTYDKIIGESAAIKNVLKTIDRMMDSDINVFLHGETGTGKELLAQAIHYHGPRKHGPFIAENCTALSETLLESELFGHTKGSFTGAHTDKIGLFEMAHGGTLFLDEVGDMGLSMQAKLLRVIQEGEVRPVGAKDYRKVEVRLISASNKDLKELMAQGKFRQDLYYRIKGIQINLPSLRERREDIPLLIGYFLAEEAKKAKAKKVKISKEALKILMDYDWPGNIRELQNEIHRAIAMGASKISVDLLSSHLREVRHETLSKKGLDGLIAELERQTILDAMKKSRGNKVRAAKLLKIGRRTLYTKLSLYGIDAES